MKLATILLGGAALVLSAVTTAFGGDLALQHYAVARFSELRLPANAPGENSGAVDVYTPPTGKVFLRLSLQPQIQWTDALENYELKRSDFSLKEPGGEELQIVGELHPELGYKLEGSIPDYLPLLQKSRPFEWQKKPAESHLLHHFYLVTAKQTKLKFKCSSMDVEIKLPPVEAYEPGRELEFEVLSARMVPPPAHSENFPPEARTTVINRDGAILEVTIQVKRKSPRSAEDVSPDWLGQLDSRDITLGFGRGGHASRARYKSQFGYTSGPTPFRFRDAKDEQTITMLYPVPPKLSDFRLEFQGREVAKGKVAP